MAIALFYLFGVPIETGQCGAIAVGYLIGAALMLAAAATEWFLGVDSEGKSLEEVASLLSAEGSFPSLKR